jgi:[lysine-biosynthesis-protein LysW]---L-2-aminoadipate ligase
LVARGIFRGLSMQNMVMRVALVAHRENETNLRIVGAAPPGVEIEIVPPSRALGRLRPGDAALGRLDVLPTLDGIEPGIWEIGRLEAEGVHVLNRLRVLLATHDKLQTSRALGAAGVPHPRTAHLIATRAIAPIEPPVVVKPRFGSWGRDVTLCESRTELMACLEDLSTRTWFRRQGVLVQELIPPLGHDLRLVVAGGQVVGAVRRVAAEGEWRTNVALGAERESTEPPQAAREIAVAAAAAVEGDLVGVDLMPTEDGGWVVIEVNGAVEFTDEYSLGQDIFSATIDALLASLADARDSAVAALA